MLLYCVASPVTRSYVFTQRVTGGWVDRGVVREEEDDDDGEIRTKSAQ